MDPIIEQFDWQHFHVGMTMEIARLLGPQLPEYYQLSAELVVKENENPDLEGKPSTYRPDIGVVQTSQRTKQNGGGSVATLTPPSRQVTMPMPKQRELRIRDVRNQRLVTAIEVLSPSNKKGLGSTRHALKLQSYWDASVSTVDIDLLRRGDYPYANEELQLKPTDEAVTDYRIISVIPEGPASVWEFGVLDQLPTIPIPLNPLDRPVVLNLQHAFTELYAYSTYPKRKVEELEGLRLALTKDELDALRAFL
jgi:hypothetical protein